MNQLNTYTFCPKCGVDITIFSHEDNCPLLNSTPDNSNTDTSSTLQALVPSIRSIRILVTAVKINLYS